MEKEINGTLALRDSYLRSAQTPMPKNLMQINQDFIQLIQHAAANSSYWRERLPKQLFNDGPDAIQRNLELFPFANRIEIQENFDDLQIHIPNSSPEQYWTVATSGSTGNPVRTTKYLPTYLLEYEAITLLEWRWFRRDIKKTIVKVRIGGSTVKRIKWESPLNLLGEPGTGYEITYSGAKIDGLLALIEEMKPVYLYGAPSTLTNLAREIESSGVRLNHLEQVLTAGESLQSWQREFFAAAYQGAQIVDRYSSEEFGYLALQCPRGNHLHVISPNVYIEILNENNQPCEIGEVGRVVVTGLHTFAQPLIRYEIGDLASWAEPTNCGITWPAIAEIEGRTHEFKQLPDGTTRRVTFARTKFIKNPKLRDFQVFLFNDQIVALISVVSPLSDEEKQTIELELKERIKIDYPITMKETSILPLFKKAKRNSIEIIDRNFDQSSTEQVLIQLVEPITNA